MKRIELIDLYCWPKYGKRSRCGWPLTTHRSWEELKSYTDRYTNKHRWILFLSTNVSQGIYCASVCLWMSYFWRLIVIVFCAGDNFLYFYFYFCAGACARLSYFLWLQFGGLCLLVPPTWGEKRRIGMEISGGRRIRWLKLVRAEHFLVTWTSFEICVFL